MTLSPSQFGTQIKTLGAAPCFLLSLKTAPNRACGENRLQPAPRREHWNPAIHEPRMNTNSREWRPCVC
jgi:hypothetical protein